MVIVASPRFWGHLCSTWFCIDYHPCRVCLWRVSGTCSRLPIASIVKTSHSIIYQSWTYLQYYKQTECQCMYQTGICNVTCNNASSGLRENVILTKYLPF